MSVPRKCGHGAAARLRNLLLISPRLSATPGSSGHGPETCQGRCQAGSAGFAADASQTPSTSIAITQTPCLLPLTLFSCSWFKWPSNVRGTVPGWRSRCCSSCPARIRNRAMVSFHARTAGSSAGSRSMRCVAASLRTCTQKVCAHVWEGVDGAFMQPAHAARSTPVQHLTLC